MSSLTVALGIIYLILGTIGMTTNLTVCLLMGLSKKLKNPTYTYMVNHLISDMFCLFPISIYTGFCMLVQEKYIERFISVFVDLVTNAKRSTPKTHKKVQIQTGPKSGKPKLEPEPPKPKVTTLLTTSAELSPTPPQTFTTIELDSLRAAPVPKNTVTLEWEKSSTNKHSNDKFRVAKLVISLDMHNYGKVVGLAYKNGKLYVPSYQFGNISVFSTTGQDLTPVAEFKCPDKCNIYDMVVLSNSDMVVAQGKNKKLTKLNADGQLMVEIKLDYLTKGLAVSQYDEIFVMTKQHDQIYVYDAAQLTELGVIPLNALSDVPQSADCNFMDYKDDTLYLSCDQALYALDIQGNLKFSVKPSNKGAFGVGVSVDAEGRLLAGLRGTEAVDVFDKGNGQYKETVGDTKDSLWSDIVAGDNSTMYVVDYITATIKTYRY